MTLDAAPGLRERKRLATRRAIQVAVLDLASERGLDKVTIDEVSRIADISPRTFFNYFATKEEALLGDAPHLPGDEQIELFVNAGPHESVFAGLGVMLSSNATLTTDDIELTLRRRGVMREHPQLFALRLASMKSFEANLAEVIARRLVMDDPALAGAPERLDNDSKLVAALAFGATRHAWSCWAAEENLIDLSSRIRAAFDDVDRLLAKA